MQHILSAEQFADHDQLQSLFDVADDIREEAGTDPGRRRLAGRYLGSRLCNLFYEPSTRTRLSFQAAADGLGIRVSGTENAREFSSAAKGETLEDTVRVLGGYFDVIVLRHHETGAAARAAAVSRVPMINAGDGKGEHPTQALLDAYTIYRQFGRLDNLNVVMGGDLANGRTVRSLARLLATYNSNSMTFVSVPELQIGKDIKQELVELGVTHTETDDMMGALRLAQVVYWTRLQKERLANPEAVPDSGFTIDVSAAEAMPYGAIIMHPLPRGDEISPEVDANHRATYFKQAENGLWVRMALLDHVLQKL